MINDGAVDSNTASRQITVTAVNDAPVNSVPAAQFTPPDIAKVFSTGNGNLISIADVDAASSTVQVQLVSTNGATTLSGTSGLSFSVGDGTADATMTFTGTITSINTALAGLSFNPTASFTGAASLQIVTSDQGNTGSGGTLTDNDTVSITVSASTAPVVTPTGSALAYTENGTPVLDSGITVTDADSANLASATVTMTTNYVNGQDVLAFVNQNGITGTWTAGTGVLSLTGSSSVANYQTALRSITYNNNSDAPSTSARTVTFVVNDGANASNTGSRQITLTAVNDAPVNSVPAAQFTPTNNSYSQGRGGYTFSSGNGNLISISDTDAASSTVQTQLVSTNGATTLSGTSGLSFSVGDGTADATMTFTGTIANINTALAGMRFTPTANFTGTASLQIVTSDQGNTGSGGTLTDNDTVSITVASFFQGGTDNLVVMEAENYDSVSTQGADDWSSATTNAGYSGSGYMRTTDTSSNNASPGYATTASRLDYQVNFTTTGTHYVWVRGWSLNEQSDSAHIALDGVENTTADNLDMSAGSGVWDWENSDCCAHQGPVNVLTLNVPTTGVHTVNLYVREAGLAVDRLILTTSSSYTPTSAGPTETRFPGAPSGLSATPASTSVNLTWTDNSTGETGFIVERSTTGADGSFTTVTTTAANATSHNVTGLTSSTTYYFRVRATNNVGGSGYARVTSTTS